MSSNPPSSSTQPPQSEHQNQSSRSMLTRLYHQISLIDIRPSLPFWISRFLGYRPSNSISTPIWLLTWLKFLPLPFETLLFVFFSSFLSILLICLTYSYSNLSHLNIPLSLGSAGATAIILFVTPLTPTATPRNVIFGHLIASLTSTIITRIFQFNLQTTPNVIQGEMSENLSWLTACLSMSLTAVFQVITGTVHPPGGATALLGSISPNFVKIGWEFISITLVMVSLMLSVALMIGNLGRRRYPLYWFFPSEPLTLVQLSNQSKEKKDRFRLMRVLIQDSLNELDGLSLMMNETRLESIEKLNRVLGLMNEIEIEKKDGW
ncbi:HPP family protein [Melampsora americana]|nr:HPP family protein [Melampsora americana]